MRQARAGKAHCTVIDPKAKETSGGRSIWLLLRISFGIFRPNFQGSGALKRWGL
jgi:hypothetical protein